MSQEFQTPAGKALANSEKLFSARCAVASWLANSYGTKTKRSLAKAQRSQWEYREAGKVFAITRLG
jgi:hypothetical protein